MNSSILAWGIPWTEEPGGLQSIGHKQSDLTEWTNVYTLIFKNAVGLSTIYNVMHCSNQRKEM